MDIQSDHLNNDRPPFTARFNSKSLALSFEYLPVAALGLNDKGEITYANSAARDLLGYDFSKAEGINIRLLFEDTNPEQKALERLLGGHELIDVEFKLRTKERTDVLISSGRLLEDGGIASLFLLIRDVTKLKRKEYLYAYLNHAATTLAKTRETVIALRQIADFIVPSFADWFTIDKVADHKLELVLLMHNDDQKIEWARQYRRRYPADLNGNAGPAVVIQTGKPVFIPMVTGQMIDLSVPDPVQREEVKKIGMHSVIMAPMWTDGSISGLVNFISSRPDRHFDEEDLEFALNFASLISLALQNTRLNEEAAHEIMLRTQSEERFRFLLDAIPHKMWTSGSDGMATFYNRQWHEYTGIAGFENLREQIWNVIHPDDLDEAKQKWPEAIRDGIDMEMEHRLKRYDGQFRWHLSRVSAHIRAPGEVALWVGTSTDIHDQKIFELALAAANAEQNASNQELIQLQGDLQITIRDLETSKERFQSFMDSIPQIAWASDAAGAVEYYNERWYEYTGLSFEETRNWGWKKVIHPDDLDYNLEQLSNIIGSRSPGEFEIRELGKDGVFRWHLVRLSPVFDAAGRLSQWTGSATDIDELKKLQQQRDDFISIASHELRTPLTSLKTSVQLLYRMKDQLSSPKFATLIEQANRSTHKMSTLVNDLLNVSRIKETQLTLHKQWFILSELVNACCNPFTVAGSHEIVIRGNKALNIYADEGAIDQVIVNFVNNAVKYAPGSKEIMITIEDVAGVARLSVTDKGRGIPREQIPFLFDRYYQGGKKDYRNPGLGLGLYICAEIVKKHGGEIGADSIPGEGSTFWFTLPLGGN